MDLFLPTPTPILDIKLQSPHIPRNDTKLHLVQRRQRHTLTCPLPQGPKRQFNHRMHLTVPENASRDIDVYSQSLCAAPVDGLVEPTTEFKQGHGVRTGDFIGVVSSGEIFSTDGHEMGGFGKGVGYNLVEKHETLQDFGGVAGLFVDVGGQV